MEIKKNAIAILMTVGALAAAPAMAEEAAGGDAGAQTDQRFQQMDINSDGKITRDEVAARSTLAEKFDDLDVNKDDALEQAEFSKFEMSDASSAM